MVRMVDGPISREFFSFRSVKGMDVVTPGASVSFIGVADFGQQGAGFDGSVVVLKDPYIPLQKHNLPRFRELQCLHPRRALTFPRRA